MYKPRNLSDLFALSMTKFFRLVADTFFAKRYGHRAVVLETVAGVPGMVAGLTSTVARGTGNSQQRWGIRRKNPEGNETG